MLFCSDEKRNQQRNVSARFFSSRALFVFIFVFLAFPIASFAATFSITPQSATKSVGDTFSVSVSASSASQAVNAVSGTLDYSSGTLELVSISKGGSIVNLWVQEPSYSNSAGTASFEGVILNPGFTGGSGRVLTYTFRAKAQGTGTVRLLNGSMLANDGSATELFTGANTASYTITPKQATTEPEKKPTPPTSEDGVRPALQITALERANLGDTAMRFAISVKNTETTYTTFSVRLDQEKAIEWTDDGDGIYTIPNLTPGPHILLVKALDTTENITGFLEFTVETLASPTLNYHSEAVSIDQPVVYYGKTEAGAEVTIAFNKHGKEKYVEIVRANADGMFLLISEGKIPFGRYDVSITARSTKGGVSAPVPNISLRMRSPAGLTVGTLMIDFSWLVVLFGIMIIVVLSRKHLYKKLYHELKNKPEVIVEKPIRKRAPAKPRIPKIRS